MQPSFFRISDTHPPENDRNFGEKVASTVDSSNPELLMSYLRDSEQLSALGNNEFHPSLAYSNEFAQFHQQQPSFASSNMKKSYSNSGTDEWVLSGFKSRQSSTTKEQAPQTKSKGTKKQKKEQFSKPEEEEESDLSDEWDPATVKANAKPTYSNKIQSLVAENPELTKFAKLTSVIVPDKLDLQGNLPLKATDQKPKMKKVKSVERFISPEEERLHQKLVKNRESARNSRKRKKIYVELLEKKVQELTQELFAARKQLEAANINSNQTAVQSKLISQLQNGRQQFIEKLEKLLHSDADETEINLLIDSLRLRMGASANERIQLVNYFCKQAVEQIMPVSMKYLLWSASEGKDLFNDAALGIKLDKFDSKNGTTDHWSEIILNLNLTDSQRKYILKYRKKLVQEKHRIEALIHTLNQTRKSILKESISLESVIDDLRNALSPKQVGRFIIALDKERYRKEFSPEKLWQFPGTKEEEGDDNDRSDSDDSLSCDPRFDQHIHEQMNGFQRFDSGGAGVGTSGIDFDL